MPSPNNRKRSNSPGPSGGGGDASSSTAVAGQKRKAALLTQEEEYEWLEHQAKLNVSQQQQRRHRTKKKVKTVDHDDSSSSSSSGSSSSSSEQEEEEVEHERKKPRTTKQRASSSSRQSRTKKPAAVASVPDDVEMKDAGSSDSASEKEGKEEPPKKDHRPKKQKAKKASITTTTRSSSSSSTSPAKRATKINQKKHPSAARSRVPPSSSSFELEQMPLPPAPPTTNMTTTAAFKVLANGNADLESKPTTTFITTETSLDHPVLPLAPEEAEEGYEGDNSSIASSNNNHNIHHKSRWTLWQAHTVLLIVCLGYVAVVLAYGGGGGGGSFMMIGGGEGGGDYYYFAGIVDYLSFLKTTTTTTTTTQPKQLLLSNFVKCYRNNVHTKVKYQGICAHWQPEELLECPDKALCWGGTVHDCRFGGKSQGLVMWDGPEYYQLSREGDKQCVWSEAVNDTIQELTEILQLWTLAHTCLYDNNDDDQHFTKSIHEQTTITTAQKKNLLHPKAAWLNNETRQPLFVLKDVVQNLTDPPFNTTHSEDTLEFVKMIQEGSSAFVFDDMPDLGRSRRMFGILKPLNNPHKVPAGTPLVGLREMPPRPWYYVTLPIQCWWNNIPRAMGKPKKSNSGHTKANSKLTAGALAKNETKPTKIKGAQEKKKSGKMASEKETRIDKPTPSAAKKSSESSRKTPRGGTAVDHGSKKKAAMNEATQLRLNLKSRESKSKSMDEFAKPKRMPNDKQTSKAEMAKRASSREETGAKNNASKTKEQREPRILSVLRNILKRIDRAIFLKQPIEDMSNTTNDTTTKPSASTYVYPLVSVIGLIGVIILQVKRERSRLYRKWRPEIANLKDLAIVKIEEATNGGWVLSHLAEAVIGASIREDDESDQYEHLVRNIWPRVVEALQRDDRLKFATVVSNTTGQAQLVVSWLEDSASTNVGVRKKTSRRRVTIQEPA